MTRKFIVSILSLCLLVHSAGTHADISQLMVDHEGHTIKLRRDGGQLLFNDVVSGIVAACNMSTNATQPPSSFTEQQYWSLINYNYKYNSYLSVFRDPNITDDAMMNQTLSCSAATAQNIIVSAQTDKNDLVLLEYLILAVIPITLLAAFATVKIRQRCCTAQNGVANEIQLEAQNAQLPTASQDVPTGVSVSQAQPDSVIISLTPSNTISEVALSDMSDSAVQSLRSSLSIAPSSG